MTGWRQVVALGILLASGACAPPTRDEELLVERPFAKANVWSDHLYVRLTPGTPLAAVIRIPVTPLTGGMTLEEATTLAGPPSSSGAGPLGTYYSFGPKELGVTLVHLQYQDSGPVDKWVVTATPEDNSLAALVSHDLIALLSKAGAIGELTIRERKRPRLQAFHASVQDGHLLHLQWYTIQGIPGDRSPHNDELQRTRPARAMEPRR